MNTNQKPPSLKIVTPQGYRYKSFTTPILENELSDADKEEWRPKVQAIVAQASCLLYQHELGHCAMVSPPLHGIYFVFSFPEGGSKDATSAKCYVSNILKNAFWNLDKKEGYCSYASFSDVEINHMVGKTTHLTKYHVKIFGWDKFEQTNADLMQTAKSLCAERGRAEAIKEQLPMFSALPDATLDDLAREGRLPHVLSRFLEPATEPRLKYCEHNF